MGTQRSRERITKPCDHCGEPVTRLKSADAPRFYCNSRCYHASDNRAQVARALTRKLHPNGNQTTKCAGCGVLVSRPLSKIRDVNFCTKECQYRHRREQGKKFINSNGYVVIGCPVGYPGARVNGKHGQIAEHRKVMQEIIGRALLPEENVHHINGVRTDNRPENLELWTRSQPSGQRVKDKVAWAKYILETYGDQFA